MVIMSFGWWTESVLQCQRKKKQEQKQWILCLKTLPVFFIIIIIIAVILNSLSLSLCVLQVSIPSWRFISLCSWSTPQASSKYTVSCPVAPQTSAHLLWADVSSPLDRCCPHRPVSVFRWRLLCVYVQVHIVHQCYTRLRRVYDWIYVWFSLNVCVCVFSDPQSSRARKLCVTMEPALLLKGDIMVRNGRSWTLLTCTSCCFTYLLSSVSPTPADVSALINTRFPPDGRALL